MFHRFSAKPAKARGQSRGSGNKNKDRDSQNILSSEQSTRPLTKRQKVARACDRCRLHRIKCDQQKPCTHCVTIQAKCTVSYAPSESPERNTSNVGQTTSGLESVSNPTLAPPSSAHATSHSHDDRPNSLPGSPLSSTGSLPSPQATSSLPNPVHNKSYHLAHLRGFFTSEQWASSHSSTSTCFFFRQLPHPTLPSGENLLWSETLLETQRSFYLELFWNECHPFLQMMSESEFADLNALPPPARSDEYSARKALVDSMLALGIQHTHVTGLTGRILGLQQPHSRSSHDAAASARAIWPGFEYFNRCRACMRMHTEVTLEILQCHALMIVYLMKGNAFRDAYNLLGITIRKAYVVKLHRTPPNHLPESEKTSHMQLWWDLFHLDLQCSLQLDMPTASQKSLVKCPVPTDERLGDYFSSIHREESVEPYMYTSSLVNLAITVTDISSCFSAADLDEDESSSPAEFERHALKLSSAFQSLEIWHDQLPPGLRLNQGENGSCNAGVLDFDRDLSIPIWLRRQRVLLELQYHNVYILFQRRFIHLRYKHSNDPSDTTALLDSGQLQAELHISSAVCHATMVIKIVVAVCSRSEVLYGWPEVLQPLWNATLAIIAYVYINPLDSTVPHALDFLSQAQDIFNYFSSTSPSAYSANAIIQSVARSLQAKTAQGSTTVPNADLIDWDVFTSLLEEQNHS